MADIEAEVLSQSEEPKTPFASAVVADRGREVHGAVVAPSFLAFVSFPRLCVSFVVCARLS